RIDDLEPHLLPDSGISSVQFRQTDCCVEPVDRFHKIKCSPNNVGVTTYCNQSCMRHVSICNCGENTSLTAHRLITIGDGCFGRMTQNIGPACTERAQQYILRPAGKTF